MGFHFSSRKKMLEFISSGVVLSDSDSLWVFEEWKRKRGWKSGKPWRNGVRKKVTVYNRHGIKHGPQTFYNKQGIGGKSLMYKDGKRDGVYMEFKGTMVVLMGFYKDGKKSGRWVRLDVTSAEEEEIAVYP